MPRSRIELRRGRLAPGQVTHHRRIAVQLDQQVGLIGSEAAQGQALGLQVGVHLGIMPEACRPAHRFSLDTPYDC